MQPAICLLAVIPMRAAPSHRSEMVSQVLFGESVLYGEESGDFVKVECTYDGYQGWVQQNQLTKILATEVLQTTTYTTAFTTPVTKNGSLLHVPYATPVYEQQPFSYSAGGYMMNYLLLPQQTLNSKTQQLSRQTLEAIYQPFVNTPYLWGGKSVFGVDCSGFVQQVFKLFGIRLLRDAYLQAEQGQAVASLAEARPGDLAFFCNEGGRVTHVGIILEENKIIHASGNVRIDSIDERGIVNSETGRQTHTLHSIGRIS